MEALAGLLTGGASLAGTLFTNAQNAQNAQNSNAFNWMMQLQKQAYDTQMSNTQYQRGVTDMKAAGLNPALMFGSGGPATSPTAGNMSAVTPNVENPGNSISSALQGSKLIPELKNLISQNSAIEKGLEKTQAEIEGQNLQNINTGRAGDVLFHNVRKASADSNRAEEDAATAAHLKRKEKANADLAEMNRDDYRDVGPGDVDASGGFGGKYGARGAFRGNLRTLKRSGITLGTAVGNGAAAVKNYVGKPKYQSPPAAGPYGGLSHGKFYSNAADDGTAARLQKYGREHYQPD